LRGSVALLAPVRRMWKKFLVGIIVEGHLEYLRVLLLGWRGLLEAVTIRLVAKTIGVSSGFVFLATENDRRTLKRCGPYRSSKRSDSLRGFV